MAVDQGSALGVEAVEGYHIQNIKSRKDPILGTDMVWEDYSSCGICQVGRDMVKFVEKG